MPTIYFYRCIGTSLRDSGIKSWKDGVASTVAYRVDMGVVFLYFSMATSIFLIPYTKFIINT